TTAVLRHAATHSRCESRRWALESEAHHVHGFCVARNAAASRAQADAATDTGDVDELERPPWDFDGADGLRNGLDPRRSAAAGASLHDRFVAHHAARFW